MLRIGRGSREADRRLRDPLGQPGSGRSRDQGREPGREPPSRPGQGVRRRAGRVPRRRRRPDPVGRRRRAPLRGPEGRARDAGDDASHLGDRRRRARRERRAPHRRAGSAAGRRGSRSATSRPRRQTAGRWRSSATATWSRSTPRRTGCTSSCPTTRSRRGSPTCGIRRRGIRPASSRSTRASSARPRPVLASVPER